MPISTLFKYYLEQLMPESVLERIFLAIFKSIDWIINQRNFTSAMKFKEIQPCGIQI